MVNVLFVCTQNAFRSLSAQKLLEKYLTDNNIEDVFVDSVGTVAYEWEKPYSYTLDKLKELGVIVTELQSNTKIQKEHTRWADIIICMTQSHQAYVRNYLGKKSFLFNEIVKGEKTDLQDDVESEGYGSLESFVNNTIDYIANNIEALYKNLGKFII